MIDRLREQIQERLDQLASEADRLRKALAALDPRSPKPPATQARGTERQGDDCIQAGLGAEARANATDEHASRSPRRTAPGATKAAVLAALAGGEAMTAGEVASKAGLAARDRLDDAVEARQVRRGGEGRARLPAHGWRTLLAGGVASRRSLLFAPAAGATVGSCSRSASGSTSTPCSSGTSLTAATAPRCRTRGHTMPSRSVPLASIEHSAVRASAATADRPSRPCSATSSNGPNVASHADPPATD